MSTFTFTVFKDVMDIQEIPEATYGFIMKTVFEHIKTLHSIDLDALDAEGVEVYKDGVPMDLQYAIFSHAKYLYEQQTKNTAVVTAAKDSAGDSVSYTSSKIPSFISVTYRNHSPIAPILL